MYAWLHWWLFDDFLKTIKVRRAHCRFLVPGNRQQILTEIWHQFWEKNDGENICHWNFFISHEPYQSYQLAGNSERNLGGQKIISIIYIFTIIFSQNWWQIFVRIFWALQGIIKLQWADILSFINNLVICRIVF